MSHNGMASIK